MERIITELYPRPELPYPASSRVLLIVGKIQIGHGDEKGWKNAGDPGGRHEN